MRRPSDALMVRAMKSLVKTRPGITTIYESLSSPGFDIEPRMEPDDCNQLKALLTKGSVIPPLFDFQNEVKNKVMDCYGGPEGSVSALVSMPTGSGKTRTIVHAILHLFTKGNLISVLWVAPSRELLRQAFGTFKKQWTGFRECPDLFLSDWREEKTEVVSPIRKIMFSTPQLILSRENQGFPTDGFDIVVFDEAHQSSAPEFKRSVMLVRKGGKGLLIGLSATPGRHNIGEIQGLTELYGGHLITSDILGDRPIDKLVKMGVLSRVDYMRLHPSKITGRKKISDSSWSEIEILKVVLRIVGKTEKRHQKVIIFAQSLIQAAVFTALLKSHGLSAEMISGTMGTEQRISVIEEFVTGKKFCLINVDLLVAGFDCPDIQHVVIARKISSPVLYEQIVGRAIRGYAVGGTRKSYVWDFFDNHLRHGELSSYMRYRDYDW